MAEPDPELSEALKRELPEAVVERRHRASLPLIWLVPLTAMLIGGWLAVRAILELGPTIAITFSTADGLEPGKTKVRYRNVEIGELRSVALTDDRKRVVATLELSRQAQPMLVEDTRFWVVRPRVTGAQVSGLGTLISGSYIGMDVGRGKEPSRAFTGLETPPIVTLGLPGRHFDLRGSDLGSVDIGAPVYLRRVRVGQVVAFALDADGLGVTVKIFIESPHDRHVTPATRFWHSSGLEVAVDAGGLRLSTESLASLVLGGIAFETPTDLVETGNASERTVYRLFSNRNQAMKHPDSAEETYVLVFDESVRGLSAGAPVDFRGVVVGEVVSVNVDSRPERGELHIPVKIRLYPRRIAPRGTAAATDEHDSFFDRLVQRGLRAQLRTGNLLTGQLYVALDFFPHAARAGIDRNATPPRIPTIPGSLNELENTLRRVAQRLEKFPLESIGSDLGKALASADSSLRRLDDVLRSADHLMQRLDGELAPELVSAVADLRHTLSSAEKTLAPDSPMQHDLRETLRQIGRAADTLRALADYLERNPDALLRGRREEQR